MTYLRHYFFAIFIEGWEHVVAQKYASNMVLARRRGRIERLGRA